MPDPTGYGPGSGYTPNDPNYSLGPSFINPAYSTPEQRARIKLLSEMLLKQGNEPAKHWTEAIGNTLQALVGTLQGNRYDQLSKYGVGIAADRQDIMERQRQGNIAAQQGGGTAPSGTSLPAQPGGAATPYAPETSVPEGLPPEITSGASSSPATAQAMKYFTDKGYSPAAAAGIVGNLVAESGSNLDPRAVGDSGQSLGIAQWNGPRRQALMQFAAQTGRDPSDRQTQLDFVHHELQTSEAKTGRALQGATDPTAAALAFTGYERPQGWSAQNPAGAMAAQKRIAQARALMGNAPQVGAGPMRMAQALVPGEYNPTSFSRFMQDPNVNPETQKFYQGQVTPAPYTDVRGRPGTITSQAGARPLPVQRPLEPGIMQPVAVGPEGGVTTTMPVPATSSSSGPRPSFMEQIQPLFDASQKLGQQAAVGKANRGQIASDVETAYQAVPIRQTLRAMKDDILSHGDKMIFGPTADWINNLRKGIAQHAPGFLNENDIAGLAAADSFEKLSTQLQSIVGRQVGGTDASLLQGIRSVPGTHNSKEGALALIDMLDQAAGLNSQFIQENQYKIGQPGFNYLAEKNSFFDKHPIINPISKNPIRIDIQKGGGSPIRTKVHNGKTYFEMAPGQWHEGL